MNAPQPRPRVEGEREAEILRTALDLLGEVGYDRLTMDALAQRAHVSKATLYRRWQGKQSLIIDALLAVKGVRELPDTGSLRQDLLDSYCGTGGLADPASVATLAGVMTALAHDAAFAAEFRERVLGPKLAATARLYERARDRGEIRADADIDVLAGAVAGIVLHRHFVFGELPILPALILPALILPALRPEPAADEAAHSETRTTP